ncbi:helix-turn-helix domain-containing protein [Microbulbifer taiwanensis]|uniref:Helix-turn-helix domain-containing protein n=1 Tax=Microbulbifer taiwanensis TaxID=986746 RepID=A0ABW1YRI4_9GAMM|nr:helix-turn-helix domain-containing protein [Microbulbifer taiwanensis]
MNQWVEKIEFDNSSPLATQGREHQFGFRRHCPEIMDESHWHGHIEINYLFDCCADYLIDGRKIHVPEGRMILFWASIPHQMIASEGDGEMVNIYIPLHAFLSWKFPERFVSELLHGAVLVSDNLYDCDRQLTRIWERDLELGDAAMTAQVIGEIRARVRRMSLETYSSQNTARVSEGKGGAAVNGLDHVQKMLRYIADHYDQKITIDSVARTAGLHQNYAMRLFSRVMKVSIKQYINQLRLQHAQALLVDTQNAVLEIAMEAGFGSVSRFYDNFQRAFHMSPLEFRNSALRRQAGG